jgi:hypothetical protein
MPAVSKAQQRFMGMVHAVQKGDMEAPSKEVDKAADSMTKKDAKDYASTSHKGLPNKKENMNTTITKERLKELVKEVMVEENEYQAFFKKALEKAGKGINDMNDEEKKAFFDKVDTAWSGKGEKNEDVSTELPKATIPSAVKMKLSMALDKIKDAKLNNTQKLQLVAQVVDSLGVDKSQLGTIANKIRSKMESVTEARDADGNEFPELEDVKTAVKKIIQNNDVEKLLRNKVTAYLQKEKGFTGAGNMNSSRLFDKVINDLLKH